jgi:Zn-dependent M28 family amino/carboxypeptidase
MPGGRRDLMGHRKSALRLRRRAERCRKTGRLNGTNSTGAVLLVAHHDSVATGLGALDGGSGVVTLIETLRALRSSAPLRNDVVFTDGEEDGGLGHKRS